MVKYVYCLWAQWNLLRTRIVKTAVQHWTFINAAVHTGNRQMAKVYVERNWSWSTSQISLMVAWLVSERERGRSRETGKTGATGSIQLLSKTLRAICTVNIYDECWEGNAEAERPTSIIIGGWERNANGERGAAPMLVRRRDVKRWRRERPGGECSRVFRLRWVSE